MNINYDHYESNSLDHSNLLIRIPKLIISKIKMSEKHLTKIKYNCLSNNLYIMILCDIIQDRLLFNYLQRVVIKKVLNYAILNKRN